MSRAAARKRIVVLGGAGAMGRITVRDLVRTGRGRVVVVVGDRDVAAASTLGVEATAVDVTDPASLRCALDGAFAVIASLPYRHNLQAMHGALAAGVHYVDLGGLFHTTRRQLELAPEFERAGRMALLGMGSAPGILNVLAVHAARDLDAVRAIHCMVGAVDSTRWRQAPPLGFGYSPDTLLDEFAMESAVYRNGAFRMVPALDPRERIVVRFPAPVGTLDLDSTLHSEVATLPLSFADRGVREVTFRQGFEPEFMDKLRFLVQLGLADTQPVTVPVALAPGSAALALGSAATAAERAAPAGRVPIVPRHLLLELLRRFPAAEPVGRPARYEILRTQVLGRRRGRAVVVTADCHAGPRAGWGIGPDIDTGAPPSIAVQLLLTGEMPLRPGVWAPEQVVPVAAFERELARRGMRVTCRTTHPPEARSTRRRSHPGSSHG